MGPPTTSDPTQLCARPVGSAQVVLGVLHVGRAALVGLARSLTITIDLVVQIEKVLRDFGAEARDTGSDALDTVAHDRVGAGDVAETAGADRLVDTTSLLSLADRASPVDEALGEVVIGAAIGSEMIAHDLALDRLLRPRLVDVIDEAFEEGVVDVDRRGVATVLGAATVSVARSDDGETLGRGHDLLGLLEQDGLAFEDALQADELVGRTVDLVKEKDRAFLHRLDHRAFLEDGLAVLESETPEEIVLVSLRGDLDTEVLAAGTGTGLFNQHGLPVAARPEDVDRVEALGLDDLGDESELAPADIGLVDLRDESALFERCVDLRSGEVHLGVGLGGFPPRLLGNLGFASGSFDALALGAKFSKTAIDLLDLRGVDVDGVVHGTRYRWLVIGG